jgi:hypothetical protein
VLDRHSIAAQWGEVHRFFDARDAEHNASDRADAGFPVRPVFGAGGLSVFPVMEGSPALALRDSGGELQTLRGLQEGLRIL